MFARYALSMVLIIGAQMPLNAEDGPRVQEEYDKWQLLKPEFESTGGGGIIIRGYNPVVSGNVCHTAFTATDPNGLVYENLVEFEAQPIQDGILCKNGKWRAKDGSSSGTTPFRVFYKGGVWRRSP